MEKREKLSFDEELVLYIYVKFIWGCHTGLVISRAKIKINIVKKVVLEQATDSHCEGALIWLALWGCSYSSVYMVNPTKLTQLTKFQPINIIYD